jgi:citrate lyase gamma subunit
MGTTMNVTTLFEELCTLETKDCLVIKLQAANFEGKTRSLSLTVTTGFGDLKEETLKNIMKISNKHNATVGLKNHGVIEIKF